MLLLQKELEAWRDFWISSSKSVANHEPHSEDPHLIPILLSPRSIALAICPLFSLLFLNSTQDD